MKQQIQRFTGEDAVRHVCPLVGGDIDTDSYDQTGVLCLRFFSEV